MQHVLKERIKFQNIFIQNISKGGDQNLNLKDLVAVQNDQTKNILKLEETETLIEQTLHYIKIDYGEINIGSNSISNIINVAQIKTFVDLALGQVELNSLEAEALKRELELNRLELNIEKAEARSGIGYIQSNIDTDKGDSWSDHIGFQVGVRIPIVNPDKPKLNRQRVELLETEAKTASKLTQLEQEKMLNDMFLKRLINRYQIVLDRILVAEGLPLTSTSQVDWSQILALKNYQLQLLEEKIEIEKQVREVYLDFLNTRNILVGTPMLNYLSQSFSPIEPS
jgi:hypothetical protein